EKSVPHLRADHRHDHPQPDHRPDRRPDFAGIRRRGHRFREVPGMKSYLGLIPLSAKVRRRQNRMTVLCILIAVLLVTAIFSMADMAIRMETDRGIDTHGHWHAMLKSLPEETADAVTAEPEVKALARYDGLNFALSEDYTMDGKPCVVVGGDEAILTEIYDDL